MDKPFEALVREQTERYPENYLGTHYDIPYYDGSFSILQEAADECAKQEWNKAIRAAAAIAETPAAVCLFLSMM